MLFYIDQILNVIERYNELRDINNHITLEFFIEELDDVENESEIEKLIQEIERRL